MCICICPVMLNLCLNYARMDVPFVEMEAIVLDI